MRNAEVREWRETGEALLPEVSGEAAQDEPGGEVGADGAGAPEPDTLSPGCPVLAYEVQNRFAPYVCAAWPEQPLKAIDVALCESGLGRHPDTFRLDAIHGGPFQIARSVWAPWFAAHYGWSWEQVVTDPAIHVRAARIIYDRAGGWAPWPVCGR